MRFTASSTEAAQLATRVARAWTGRRALIQFEGHYHGWHDEGVAPFAPRPRPAFTPVPRRTSTWPSLAICDGVARLLESGDVAAVLLEPGGGSAGGLPTSREWLVGLRRLTREYGGAAGLR